MKCHFVGYVSYMNFKVLTKTSRHLIQKIAEFDLSRHLKVFLETDNACRQATITTTKTTTKQKQKRCQPSKAIKEA